VIPATVSYVGDYAFDGASAKTAIIGRADEFGYGRSMELGNYLFTSVETAYLGEYVKTVTEATFHTGLGWHCNMLQAIHVDEDNPYYSSDEYGILFNKDKTTLICCPNRFRPSYTIPDSVTTIGRGAFENCLKLKNVTLGENSGKKITVPWHDKNGTPRTLNNIRQDLIKEAGKEEAQHVFNETNRPVAVSIKNDIKNVLNLFRIKKR
jgi:hypothetical protein